MEADIHEKPAASSPPTILPRSPLESAAMDDRQAQIREGAGLEESKLNVEFIAWLQRWSTPIMGVIALVALGFVVANRLEKRHDAAIDRAFEELATASETANPNPGTLVEVAEQNSGIRAVPLLAQIRAADVYLQSARTGVKVGARLKDGGAVDAEEVLTDEQRTANLAEAEKLYQKVYDATASDRKKAVHALSAAYGLAAVAECRGNVEAAKHAYERAAKAAEYSGLSGQAAVAKKRIENLSKLGDAPRLFSAAELPKPPEPPKPPAPAAPGTPEVAPGVYTPTPDPAPTGATNPPPGATGSTGAPPAAEPPASTAPSTTPPAATPPATTPPANTPPADPKPGEPAPK